MFIAFHGEAKCSLRGKSPAGHCGFQQGMFSSVADAFQDLRLHLKFKSASAKLPWLIVAEEFGSSSSPAPWFRGWDSHINIKYSRYISGRGGDPGIHRVMFYPPSEVKIFGLREVTRDSYRGGLQTCKTRVRI